jgi:hypothetical protein
MVEAEAQVKAKVKNIIRSNILNLNRNPHYSRALLLQSPIRCCDKPLGGGLAPQTLDVLHEYASGPPGSALTTRLGDFATNCHE